jgi:hypothetical protein
MQAEKVAYFQTAANTSAAPSDMIPPIALPSAAQSGAPSCADTPACAAPDGPLIPMGGDERARACACATPFQGAMGATASAADRLLPIRRRAGAAQRRPT